MRSLVTRPARLRHRRHGGHRPHHKTLLPEITFEVLDLDAYSPLVIGRTSGQTGTRRP